MISFGVLNETDQTKQNVTTVVLPHYGPVICIMVDVGHKTARYFSGDHVVTQLPKIGHCSDPLTCQLLTLSALFLNERQSACLLLQQPRNIHPVNNHFSVVNASDIISGYVCCIYLLGLSRAQAPLLVLSPQPDNSSSHLLTGTNVSLSLKVSYHCNKS